MAVRQTTGAVLTCIFAVLLSCSPVDKSHKELGVKELDRAISAISDRREAEIRVIAEQTQMIVVLEQRLDAAQTEGMKDKIRSDIAMKELSIEKARKNLENQDILLKQLTEKRDSLIFVGK